MAILFKRKTKEGEEEKPEFEYRSPIKEQQQPEKQTVNQSLILQGQGIQCVRYRENCMKIDDGEDMLFSGNKPSLFGQAAAFGTVAVPARVVKRLLVSAAFAACQMTPK